MNQQPDFHRPTAITQQGNESLDFQWADGHVSVFPLSKLRRLCPCAKCREGTSEPTSSGPFTVLGPEPSSRPAKLEQAGNYAIAITWSDEHYSIFSFDLLRAACPCDTCVKERAAGRT